MAATSANFVKGREKHLNEGSGYRRERMHVPLPAEGWEGGAVAGELLHPSYASAPGRRASKPSPGAVAHLQQRWHSL